MTYLSNIIIPLHSSVLYWHQKGELSSLFKFLPNIAQNMDYSAFTSTIDLLLFTLSSHPKNVSSIFTAFPSYWHTLEAFDWHCYTTSNNPTEVEIYSRGQSSSFFGVRVSHHFSHTVLHQFLQNLFDWIFLTCHIDWLLLYQTFTMYWQWLHDDSSFLGMCWLLYYQTHSYLRYVVVTLE